MRILEHRKTEADINERLTAAILAVSTVLRLIRASIRPGHTSLPRRIEDFAEFCARITRLYA